MRSSPISSNTHSIPVDPSDSIERLFTFASAFPDLLNRYVGLPFQPISPLKNALYSNNKALLNEKYLRT